MTRSAATSSTSIILAAPLVAFFCEPSPLHAMATPPRTEARAVTETIHGETFVDPYRWLESLEAEDPEVATWTTLQNDYTAAVLHNLPCRGSLVEELSALMNVPSIGTPVQAGEHLFFAERAAGANQSVLKVRPAGGGKADDRVLLDPNTLDDGGLVSLDWWRPTLDGSQVAFGISRAGDENSVLHVLRTADGTWTETEIAGKVSFGGWTPDASAFVYSKLTDLDNAYSRVVRWHDVGTHPRHDTTLLTQSEPQRVPYGSLSRDGRWIMLGLTDGWSQNDLWAVHVADWHATGTLQPEVIAEGIEAKFSPEAIVGDVMVMSTTHDAPNGKLYRVDLTHPSSDQWKLLADQEGTAVLQGASYARGTLIIQYEQDAVSRIDRRDMSGRKLGSINLPGLGSAGISTDPDSTNAFLSYTSYNEPRTIYRCDVATGKLGGIWARPDVPVDPDTVVVRRLWAKSKDGTRVPMFVVHRKDLDPSTPHPTLLYGYGGFNISLTPSFIGTNFPFYDSGGIYVVANLRGGGEFGEAWHRAGMLESKQNVFDDLYACAEELIAEGLTDSDRLVVMGGSNGGLLTGVAVTQRPELWTAVISAVPLLDMLRYQDFLMARFWVPEYGSSEDSDQFGWLRAYSPYHNVRPKTAYPAVMFTAGENDSRVHPLHARKMAALMQSMTASDQADEPILLHVERDGGHGQGKPLRLRVEEAADRWAFVFWQTGICN
jgi:prolyl oligopeptidase